MNGTDGEAARTGPEGGPLPSGEAAPGLVHRDEEVTEGRLIGCEGEIFRDVVGALERAGHGSCVSHGYEDYPERIKSDVDLVSEDATRIPYILHEHGAATVVQAIHTQRTTALWYVLYRWCGGGPAFVRLHAFYDDYRVDGRAFFEADEFLRARRPFKFFGVPPPDLEFAAYFVKKAAKRSLDDAQGLRLSELYGEDPAGCWRRLLRLLPEAEAELVAEAARSGDWEAVRGRMDYLYKEMRDRVDVKQPMDVPRSRFDDFRRRAERSARPSGLMVAFLGVDGAGKSTVMSRVESDLSPAFWSTKRYHGRALESPRRWTKRVRRQREERRRELEEASAASQAVPVVRDPHDRPSRGVAVSLIKLALWWADYTFLGYLAEVHPRLRRSGLVLFDRYYQDLLVDPRRHRYGGPLWLARLAGRFFPQPHLFVFLDAPPEVLHARKREVSLEETTRQREAYLELARGMTHGHVVDASRPVQEVVAEVERIILDHMAERTARRLRL